MAKRPRPKRIRLGLRCECACCGVEFRAPTRRTYCCKEHKEAMVARRKMGGNRVDNNQTEIVDALESVGAAVMSLTGVGHGVPDLLVSFRNVLHLLEVKNPKNSYGRRGLNPRQKAWAENWRGRKPVVVRTPAEALAAIGCRVLLAGAAPGERKGPEKTFTGEGGGVGSGCGCENDCRACCAAGDLSTPASAARRDA